MALVFLYWLFWRFHLSSSSTGFYIHCQSPNGCFEASGIASPLGYPSAYWSGKFLGDFLPRRVGCRQCRKISWIFLVGFMLENFPSHWVREIPLPEASLFWSFARQAGQCIGTAKGRESSPQILKTQDATYGRLLYSYRGSSWYRIPILRAWCWQPLPSFKVAA